jgi:hypothetical protein
VLRPGHLFQAVVQGTPGQLTLQIANTRVPLQAGSGLQPGQQVQVEVRQGVDGMQLRVMPQTQTAPATPPQSPPPQMAPVLTTVLETLGLLQQAGPAAHMLPRELPPVAAAVRDLLSLFHHRASLGTDLERFVALARQAVRAGALPPDQTRGLEALLTRLVARDADGIEGALRAWASQGGPVEAQMARALAEEGVDEALARLRGDLKTLISQLRSNPDLLRFLRSAGTAREFEALGDRLLGRLAGGDLQNLRALEQPYFFLELPFGAEAPIQHAQIHFFGEQTGRGNTFDRSDAMVAMDLSTTQLGDLWISLRVTHGRCYCTFGATSEATLEAIERASGELVEGLAQAGYRDAVIQVRPWNGDRFAEVSALVGRFSGLDVEA